MTKTTLQWPDDDSEAELKRAYRKVQELQIALIRLALSLSETEADTRRVLRLIAKDW